MNVSVLHKMARSGSEKERIWRIADELLQKNGSIPSGKDVVDVYAKQGGHTGTGFTQYSHWKREVQKELASQNMEPTKRADPGSVDYRPLSISDDGRLTIPAEMRAAMLLDVDGRVTASVEDGVLTIISPTVAVKRLQALALSLVPEGSLVSEELIAERRKEAARE